MTAIHLSRIHYPITTLGPGRRVGVWFQGCRIHCSGCISADTWDPSVGATTTDAVLGAMAPWLSHADGATISGGEPFDQPDALLLLLRGIRDTHAGDILVFTGYDLHEIAPVLGHLEGLVDALVTGRYDEKAPQTLALRGSDNQEIFPLTALGRARFEPLRHAPFGATPTLDAMFDPDGTAWFAGIPRRGDFERLRDALRCEGHDVAISADLRKPSP